MKKYLAVICSGVFLCFLLFVLIFICIYLKASTTNWLGKGFRCISGTCISVQQIRDGRVGKYYIQIENKGMWTINPRYSDLDYDGIENLDGKPISIICMPETILPPYGNLVVSLQLDSRELLDPMQTYGELRGIMIIFIILSIPVIIIILAMVMIGVLIYIPIDSPKLKKQ